MNTSITPETEVSPPATSGKSKTLRTFIAYGLLFLTAFLIMTHCRLIVTDGSSMDPTYTPGDVLLCVKSYTPPRPGDVVLIRHDNKFVVKRIIYVADETVNDPSWLSLDDNSINNNGVMYWGSNVIPKGYVYVEGDNSQTSYDSRYKEFGLIPVEDIWGSVAWTLINQH